MGLNKRWLVSCCVGVKCLFFRGSLLAVVAGILYGSSFIPVLYIKNHIDDKDGPYNGASQFGKTSSIWF